jgi:uroporphyrinogen-III synthase
VKIKKILISQPELATKKSPYSELADKYGLKVEFHPFISVQGISVKEFRKQRIDIAQHTAVIFTTKTGIDHFFRICEEIKCTIPKTMKYFCISETVAHYLQKYIVYRKRKIFFADNTFKGIIALFPKHAEDKFLLILSGVYKPETTLLLDKGKYKYTKAILYKTVSNDLTGLDIKAYDILAFFSPQGIKSLFTNFPKFQQDTAIIGAFGPTTAKAVVEAGLRLDISAPSAEALSMPSAIEHFIKQNQKTTKK